MASRHAIPPVPPKTAKSGPQPPKSAIESHLRFAESFRAHRPTSTSEFAAVSTPPPRDNSLRYSRQGTNFERPTLNIEHRSGLLALLPLSLLSRLDAAHKGQRPSGPNRPRQRRRIERFPPMRKDHPRHQGKNTVRPPFGLSHNFFFKRLCPDSAKDKVKPGGWLERPVFLTNAAPLDTLTINAHAWLRDG